MTTFNRFIGAGNLTRDPEVRYLANDNAVASFTVAMTRRFKVNGEQREETTFLDCKAWNKLADTIGKHLAKGRNILIEGHLSQESWEDKTTGAKRSKIVCVVQGFQFIGKPDGERAQSDDGGSGDDEQPKAEAPRSSARSRPAAPAAGGDEPPF